MQTISTVDVPIGLREITSFLNGAALDVFITDKIRGNVRIVPQDRLHWSCGSNNHGTLEVIGLGAEGRSGRWYKVRNLP